jgi:V8-like Glu-specific endopeptidase
VLTAAHVIDPRPDDPNAPTLRTRFEMEDGTVGVLTPIMIDTSADLALLRPSVPLTTYHVLAPYAPEEGELLHWFGYDWHKRSNVAKRERHEGRVSRLIAGQIWIEQDSPTGTSGSCVENAQNEVVGIIWAGKELDDGREATAAVAVYGPWRAEVERLRAKAEPKPEPPPAPEPEK